MAPNPNKGVDETGVEPKTNEDLLAERVVMAVDGGCELELTVDDVDGILKAVGV